MKITLVVIGIIVCVLGLAYISTKEKWNNMTRPPKDWMQHNGIRNKIK